MCDGDGAGEITGHGSQVTGHGSRERARPGEVRGQLTAARVRW